MSFPTEKKFWHKWLSIIKTNLQDQSDAAGSGEKPAKTGEKQKPLSLRIALLLNLLDIPLFWSGVLLFSWLILEYLFGPALDPELRRKIQVYSEPLVAVFGPAAVGYWTNRLAIKMLFHPQRKNAVWWGLIHARREDLIASLAKGIKSSVISPEIIQDYLSEHEVLKSFTDRTALVMTGVIYDPEFRTDLQEEVTKLLTRIVNDPRTKEQFDQYLSSMIQDWSGESFGGKMLEWTKQLWGTSLRQKMLALLTAVPEGAQEYLLPRLLAYLETLPSKLQTEEREIEPLAAELIAEGLHRIDFEKVIREQLGKLDATALERLLTSEIVGELVFIQTSGGIFGFLVGLAILYPLLRPVFFLGGLLLWGIYHLTVEKE